MRAARILLSRLRVYAAKAVLHMARAMHLWGRQIIEDEEIRWGLRAPATSRRVPTVGRVRH